MREYLVLERVGDGVPADTHQAGLDSGRDLIQCPPATDPELSQAPGRFVSASCDASGIGGQLVRAMLAGTMPPTLRPARWYDDVAYVYSVSYT